MGGGNCVYNYIMSQKVKIKQRIKKSKLSAVQSQLNFKVSLPGQCKFSSNNPDLFKVGGRALFEEDTDTTNSHLLAHKSFFFFF